MPPPVGHGDAERDDLNEVRGTGTPRYHGMLSLRKVLLASWRMPRWTYRTGCGMRSTHVVHWSGCAAILGGLVGVVLTPFAATAYFLSGYEDAVPVWLPVLRPLLAPWLTFAAPPAVYAAYGRGFVVVFVLVLVGLRGLYVATYDRLDWQRLPGFGLAFIGGGLNVLGNLGDYWLGHSSIEQFLSSILFLFGTIIGTVALLSGVLLIGVADVTTRVLPPWSRWALLLAPPLGVFLSIWPIGHIPSGYVLPLSLAWIVVGTTLWSRRKLG